MKQKRLNRKKIKFSFQLLLFYWCVFLWIASMAIVAGMLVAMAVRLF